MNHTLIESAHTMLQDAGLLDSYWTDAVEYATHTQNVVPTHTLSGKSPIEAYSGNLPDVSRFHIFGCKAYVHIPDEKCKKLDSKMVQCIHWICG